MPNRPSFNATEKCSMQAASLTGHTAWDKNPALVSLKIKIKDFDLGQTRNQATKLHKLIKLIKIQFKIDSSTLK